MWRRRWPISRNARRIEESLRQRHAFAHFVVTFHPGIYNEYCYERIMGRYRVMVYSSEPRGGARPSAELFLYARSQADASFIAMERLARFSWVQLDTTDAPSP
jgi:hypothetical protein